MLNRTAGGIGSTETNTDGELMAKLSVIANQKTLTDSYLAAEKSALG